MNGKTLQLQEHQDIIKNRISSALVLAQKLKKEHGNIDILINNAGIIVGKYFHEHTATEIEKTLNTNTEQNREHEREQLRA